MDEYIIVAMTRNRVIGKETAMPWHIPEELKLFKKLTLGNTVVMGRKTFLSIGRPLPQRHNIVVSASLSGGEGYEVCRTLDSAMARARDYRRDIFYLGGVGIFEAVLHRAGYMHVSWIKEDYAGDLYFPEFDESAWALLSSRDFREFSHALYRNLNPT